MIAICDDVLFIVLPIFVFFYFFISLETAKTQRAKTESDNPPLPACAQFILSVQLTHYRFLQEFSRQALIDDGAQSVDCRVRGSAAVRWK